MSIERPEAERIYRLIRDLTDSEPCQFDHHGGCQAHGYLTLKPGELCPQREAKEWLLVNASLGETDMTDGPDEHLFISQLRKHPEMDAEVRLYVGGKLVSGTWPNQVTRSIDAMVEAAKVEHIGQELDGGI